MNKKEYLDELSVEIKKRLPEYLSSIGREITNSGMFQCIQPQNHSHGDSTFSASANRNPDGIWVWQCHQCKIGGTTYDAAHYAEGFPVKGSGFIATTIDLSEKIGINIDYKILELSKDNKSIIYTSADIYREIDTYIREHGNCIDNLSSDKFGRNYTKADAKQISEWCTIGSINNRKITDYLISKFGEERVLQLPFTYEKNSIIEIDPLVFNNDKLTIVMKTMYDKVVGFQARSTNKAIKLSEEKGNKIAKYKFANGFSGHRDSALHLANINKKHIREKKIVHITEGLFDAIALKLVGIHTAIGINGTTITENQIDELTNLGIEEIVLVFDNDKAGMNALIRTIGMVKKRDIIVNVIPLPTGYDPDNIIKSDDISIFEQKTDAISYVLEHNEQFQRNKTTDEIILYNRMNQFVVNSTTSIARIRKYSEVIANISSFQPDDAFKDMEAILNKQETKGQEAINIWKKVISAENMSIQDRALILKDAGEEYFKLSAGSRAGDVFSTWSFYQSLISGELTLPTVLKTGISHLDSATSFEIGTISIISGRPSNGKTTLMRFMVKNMIEINDKLHVIYVSIDDTKATAVVNFLSAITGMLKQNVKEKLNNRTFEESPETRSVQEEIKKLFKERLDIRGYKECPNMSSIRKVLNRVRYHQKDAQIMLIIDAMNNLTDLTKGLDQRVAIEKVVTDAKLAANENDCHIALVSHLTKLPPGKIEKRPSLNDLKGTGFLEFEAKNILLVHMDMHYNTDTELSWYDKNRGITLPIIEVNVAKDKDKKANEIIPLEVDPDYAIVKEPNKYMYDEYLSRIKKAMSNKKEGDGNNDNLIT